jgi:hypothetical protein
MSHANIQSALKLIFEGIRELQAAFPHRRFTPDGKLVGDIGEVIAELEYDMEIDETSKSGHDGTASDGRRVQVKATFKDSLTFGTVPDYYIGLKLNENGTFEEIFNGPGSVIANRFSHRKDVGVKLLSFSNTELRKLSEGVAPANRIGRREREETPELETT